MTQTFSSPKSASLVVMAACIGNLLEFYNFMAFAFFAPMIAQSFFPGGNWLMKLFYALMTFAVGYVMRPAGAVVIGYYAKRAGERAALMVTFVLMAVGSLLLALTPPATQIGLLAPALIVVARMLQGFSDGGEVGPATTLIYEAAPPRLGGLLSSLQYMTQLIGSLLAVVIGLVLAEILSHDALYSWGWRVPFALGTLIVPIGIILRQKAFSGQHFPSSVRTPPPTPFTTASVTAAFPAVVFVFFMIASATTTTYLRNFGVSYAIAVLHLPVTTSMQGMAAGLVAGIVGIGIGIRAAMHFRDSRAIVLSVGVLNALVSVPLYYYATHAPGLASQLALNITMFLLSSITAVSVWQVMLDALPSANRTVIFGVIYAVAVSSFGGMTQPLTTWLIAHTNNPMIPAYLMAAIGTLGLLPFLCLHTLARRKHAPNAEPQELTRAVMAE